MNTFIILTALRVKSVATDSVSATGFTFITTQFAVKITTTATEATFIKLLFSFNLSLLLKIYEGNLVLIASPSALMK